MKDFNQGIWSRNYISSTHLPSHSLANKSRQRILKKKKKKGRLVSVNHNQSRALARRTQLTESE